MIAKLPIQMLGIGMPIISTCTMLFLSHDYSIQAQSQAAVTPNANKRKK